MPERKGNMLNTNEEVYHVSVDSKSKYDDYYNEERIELRITFLDGPLKGETIINEISAGRLDNE